MCVAWRAAAALQTDIPIVIKGVQTDEDAVLAARAGAAAVILSNHGGRCDTPKTWTILQKDGSDHLGLRYNMLPALQMALITLGCVPSRNCDTSRSGIEVLPEVVKASHGLQLQFLHGESAYGLQFALLWRVHAAAVS